MHDFSCTEVKDMHYNTLAERASYFKESKEGTFNMCRSVEKIAKAERAEGRAEEQRLHAESIRAIMSKLSLNAEEAMSFMNIPEADRETYRKLLAQ